MKNKVVLISIDGMRPDGFLKCGNPYINDLMNISSYTLTGKTVLPSITLPCHMSLFHSVPPQRHGILSNDYIPQVHKINGLFEQIKNCGKCSAMFYGWDQMRDVARPGSLKFAEYIHSYSAENVDGLVTDSALRCIEKNSPDFVFLYMVDTDEKGGHDNGWMSEAYLDCINHAVENVKRVIETVGDEYDVIITADHGGHDRSHGSDMPEDVTIPLFFVGDGFKGGKELENITILDIAPTIADIIGVLPAPEWEGKNLNKQ